MDVVSSFITLTVRKVTLSMFWGVVELCFLDIMVLKCSGNYLCLPAGECLRIFGEDERAWPYSRETEAADGSNHQRTAFHKLYP